MGTIMLVGAADELSTVMVPSGTASIITSSARSGAYRGGAHFSLAADQSAPAVDYTRLRSANGYYFDLDEVEPDAFVFGCLGDQTDDTAGLQRALDYAGNKAATVVIPHGGLFCYYSDLRALGYGGTLKGDGGSLIAKNNSRLYLGNSANFGPESDGQKANFWNLINLAIHPVKDHDGPVVILDFCDNTLIQHCDIGPIEMTEGTTSFTTGIETRYVQWLIVRDNLINVNGRPVQIWLTGNAGHNENEDHFEFHKNQLYIAKPRSSSSKLSACICVIHDKSRTAFGGMRTFVASQNHFYRDGLIDASGLMVINDQERNVAALQHGVFRGNFFENIGFCFDRQRAVNTKGDESSFLTCSANDYLQVFSANGQNGFVYGGGPNVNGIYSVDNENALQGLNVGSRAAIRFGMACQYRDFANLQNDFKQSWVLTDKEGGSLSYNSQPFRSLSIGQVKVSAGQTSVTINHGVTKFDYQGKVPDNTTYSATAVGWNAGLYVVSEDRDNQTVTFGFADPGQDRKIYWRVEVPQA